MLCGVHQSTMWSGATIRIRNENHLLPSAPVCCCWPTVSILFLAIVEQQSAIRIHIFQFPQWSRSRLNENVVCTWQPRVRPRSKLYSRVIKHLLVPGYHVLRPPQNRKPMRVGFSVVFKAFIPCHFTIHESVNERRKVGESEWNAKAKDSWWIVICVAFILHFIWSLRVRTFPFRVL